MAYTTPENNLDLCEIDTLTDGPHTLTVATTVTNNQTFWLDYIKYLPSASVSLATAAIAIDSTDPGLQFDAGWTSFSPGFETGKTGSKLSFTFTGISLLYYGFFDPSLPVDTSHIQPATLNPTGVQFNRLLFDTGNLTVGPHTLEVTYLGTPETTPSLSNFSLYRTAQYL
ncbi:hypothetical protein BJ912DRAFT_1055971 [Pholiota molesta]|nr:hypothetical protein BJ912DRAFT_1055971 [Pholiota molesta]